MTARTHGMTNTTEYRIWSDMLSRCNNKQRPSYRNYGGRGISVCDRWHRFDLFFADMGPRPSPNHSIDRLNCDGNYEPGNCRWATRVEQARNKRNNRLIEIDGSTKTMQEWAEIAGISSSGFLNRLRAGLTGSALLAPSARGGTITWRGITKTYDAWAKTTGLNPSTIAMRIRHYKWPIEKALTQGVKK